MKELLHRFFKRVDELAEYLASLKSCSFCGHRIPKQDLIDTGYRNWYACTRCWREIQAVVNEEV